MTVLDLNGTLTSAPLSLLVIQGDRNESTELLRHLKSTTQDFLKLKCVDNLSEGLKILSEDTFDAVLLDLNLDDTTLFAAVAAAILGCA